MELKPASSRSIDLTLAKLLVLISKMEVLKVSTPQG